MADRQIKAVGLRPPRQWYPDFIRWLNPAPNWGRFRLTLFGAWSIGLLAIGMWLGVTVGYRRGIEENPGHVLSREIAEIYASNLRGL